MGFHVLNIFYSKVNSCEWTSVLYEKKFTRSYNLISSLRKEQETNLWNLQDIYALDVVLILTLLCIFSHQILNKLSVQGSQFWNTNTLFNNIFVR